MVFMCRVLPRMRCGGDHGFNLDFRDAVPRKRFGFVRIAVSLGLSAAGL